MSRVELTPDEKREKELAYLRRPDVIARRRARDIARVGDPVHLAKRREQESKRFERNWSKEKLKNIAISARQRGLDFDLTEDDLVLPSHCPIFGIPLNKGLGVGRQNSPSVDRIDNSKGYVKGNVVVVSLKANAMKRDATIEELRKMVEFYDSLKGNSNE